jgi:flagellar biosynthesis regulator FlaF
MSNAALAYRRHRTPRQAEAEVFVEANFRLEAGEQAGGIALARAVADNRRLWNAVLGAVTAPDNALPAALRASLASLAHAVLRDCDAARPDIEFLRETNQAMAAGLFG